MKLKIELNNTALILVILLYKTHCCHLNVFIAGVIQGLNFKVCDLMSAHGFRSIILTFDRICDINSFQGVTLFILKDKVNPGIVKLSR